MSAGGEGSCRPASATPSVLQHQPQLQVPQAAALLTQHFVSGEAVSTRLAQHKGCNKSTCTDLNDSALGTAGLSTLHTWYTGMIGQVFLNHLWLQSWAVKAHLSTAVTRVPAVRCCSHPHAGGEGTSRPLTAPSSDRTRATAQQPQRQRASSPPGHGSRQASACMGGAVVLDGESCLAGAL